MPVKTLKKKANKTASKTAGKTDSPLETLGVAKESNITLSFEKTINLDGSPSAYLLASVQEKGFVYNTPWYLLRFDIVDEKLKITKVGGISDKNFDVDHKGQIVIEEKII